jgi:iron complex outermembrane receptor protein
VFKADYDNFQANNFFFIGTTLVTTLTNAGKVSTQGVELDFLSKPNDKLTLSGGFAYTDAQVDEFFTPPGSTPTAVKGDPLPLAPKWKGSLGAEWRLQFAAVDVLPGFTVAYQSEQFSDIGRRAALADRRIAPYGTVDATLAIADKDDRWRLTLIGRNLTDESYAALLQRGGPGGAIRYIIPRDADRYFGAQFRLNFGGK